jgi:plastocyanin
MRRARHSLFPALFLLSCLPVFGALAACGASAPAPPPAANAGKRVDAATAGTLTGRVTFSGTPPAPDLLKMNTDAACRQIFPNGVPSDATLVGPDGSVQNAFVYVKEGLDTAYTFDVPTAPVIIDQKGCRYVPRVIGVRAGQPMEVVNSDATLHNVHALPMSNLEFNEGQPAQGMRSKLTFTVPEVMVRFKCDVHSWMNAYVGVVAHPYFAVTTADGSFEIKNLPPGTYEIGAWHETFGTSVSQVTLGEKDAKTVSFTFKNE